MMNKLYNYFKVQGIEVNEKDWRKMVIRTSLCILIDNKKKDNRLYRCDG